VSLPPRSGDRAISIRTGWSSPAGRRAWLWIIVGIAAVSLVGLRLDRPNPGDIENLGQRSYDARVFTGLKAEFWMSGLTRP